MPTIVSIDVATPLIHGRTSRAFAGLLVRCAADLGLPAGEGPSPLAYDEWARTQVRPVPDSGHMRALFGNRWERALAAARFQRYLQP